MQNGVANGFPANCHQLPMALAWLGYWVGIPICPPSLGITNFPFCNPYLPSLESLPFLFGIPTFPYLALFGILACPYLTLLEYLYTFPYLSFWNPYLSHASFFLF